MQSVKQLEQFVKKLRGKDIQVIIPVSGGEKEKIGKILGEHPEKLVDGFIAFKERTGINQFSFVLAGQQPKIWKKKERPSVVLNFNKVSTKKEEFKEMLNNLANEITVAKEKPREGEAKPIKKIPQSPPLTDSLKAEKEKEVSPQPLLLKLREGLEILLPDMRGIKVYHDPKSPWIDLEREDKKTLSIWQWRKGTSEIMIGKKDYKIEEGTLLEERWEGNKRIEIRYPLRREKEEIIIDLGEIREDKVTEFLTPISSLEKKGEKNGME